MSPDFENDFYLEIHFNKDSPNPSHVFKTMSSLIDTFQSIDDFLINTINRQIKPIIILEDVEKGSLKAFFKYLIENIPDDAIQDLNTKKLIGHYLIKAKYRIIDFINKRATISSSAEIEELEKELQDTAQESNILQLPFYGSIDRNKLLLSLANLSQAMASAEQQEKILISYEDTLKELNISFKFDFAQVSDLLAAETITSENEMILKIKKPDYLGDSKWEFRHENRQIPAKMLDEKWLSDFHNRKITLKPGDSIRTKVRIEVAYDYDNEVVSTNYYILEVIKVIIAKSIDQNNFFDK